MFGGEVIEGMFDDIFEFFLVDVSGGFILGEVE